MANKHADLTDYVAGFATGSADKVRVSRCIAVGCASSMSEEG